MNISIKKIILWISVGSLCLFFLIAMSMGFFQGNQGDLVAQYHDLRIQVLQKLIDKSFNRFATVPFGPGNDTMHLTGSLTYSAYPEYVLNKTIELKDDLDVLLEKKITEHTLGSDVSKFISNYILLDADTMKQLQKVYLFKNQQDLKDLGYVVSSYRTRLNTDERKENIMISYWNIGNVRVLNPNEKFSFMDEIVYTPHVKNQKRDLGYGLAIMGGSVKNVKGGGICGAAGGIHAVVRLNKAFEVEERYNHSLIYKYMYKNTINGKDVWIPGLDSAVYSFPGSKKDFIFKNIRSYPVVLVMNADGSVGGSEELFVLSKEEDRGSLTYVGRKGNSYTWKDAHGKPFTSYYKGGNR